MVRIELHRILDGHVLAEILDLIEAAAQADGHRPVGEHKYSHLRVGALNWAGVLAYDDDQRLVGYAHMRWNVPGGRPRAAVEVVVHPDCPGPDVAWRLLDETRDLVARAGGGLLYLWVHRVEDPRDTLAARAGFRVQRELAFMHRALDARPQVGAPPPGVVLRAYAGQDDDAEFLRANNAAFAGHPENGGWDDAEFAARRDRDWFDPKGLLLAWRGDRLLGFHWTKRHAHDTEETPAHDPVGEVYVLATDPQERGLGLGRLLLDAGLAYLYDRDCRTVVLYVDRENSSAARLYERAGFAVAYSEVCYEDEVAPAVSAAAAELRRPAY